MFYSFSLFSFLDILIKAQTRLRIEKSKSATAVISTCVVTFAHAHAGDNETLCRAYGNLAAMFFIRRFYRLSLRCRRAELFFCLSSSLNNRRHRLLNTLSNLGHALQATGYHTGAVLCHRLCTNSGQRSDDSATAARELRNVGKNW